MLDKILKTLVVASVLSGCNGKVDIIKEDTIKQINILLEENKEIKIQKIIEIINSKNNGNNNTNLNELHPHKNRIIEKSIRGMYIDQEINLKCGNYNDNMVFVPLKNPMLSKDYNENNIYPEYKISHDGNAAGTRKIEILNLYDCSISKNNK